MTHIDIFTDALFNALEKTAATSRSVWNKEYLRERASGDKLTREDRKAINDADLTGSRKRHPKAHKYGIPAALTAYGAGMGAMHGGKKGAFLGGAVGAGTAGLSEYMARRAERRHADRTK